MSSTRCSTPSGPIWDGIDLNACFQKRLAGIVAGSVVATSLVALVGVLVHSLIRSNQFDKAEDVGEGIVRAENEALRELISHNGPASVERSGGGGRRARRASDLLIIFSAVAVSAVLFISGRREDEDPGREWDGVVLAAWLWTLVGAVAKQFLVSGPTCSTLAAVLDFSTACWILAYTILSGISLRSSLLAHQNVPFSVATFALTFTTALAILLRPTRSVDAATTPSHDNLPAPLGTTSSIFSRLAFSYLSPLLYTHALTPLTLSSLPGLPLLSRTPHVLLLFRLSSPPHSSISLLLLYHFRYRILQQQLWALVGVAAVALPPMCLKGLLGHIARREGEPGHLGWMWAAGMTGSMVVKTVASGQALYIGTEIGIQVKAILTSEIFAKALRRKEGGGAGAAKEEDGDPAEGEPPSEDEEESAASGKILNLISTDAPNATYVSSYLHHIWPETTLTIVVTVFLLFRVIGLAALAGLAALLLLMPLQALSSRFFYKSQERVSIATDARLTLVAEVLSAVRAIKYFAWEKNFLAKMAATREKELDALWSRALAFVTSTIILFGAPVFVSVATFTCQTQLLHRELTPEVAFTSLALFNVLRGPLETLIDTSARYLQAFISLRRIDKFLAEEETEKYSPASTAVDVPAHPVAGFVNGSFTYSSGANNSSTQKTSFQLKDLNLEFPVGKMSLVVGPVGSGKTTLLLSLLSETTALSGPAFLPSHPRPSSLSYDPNVLTDSTAYCSQSPWLLNDSIRNNVLFGLVFDEKRYGEVLDACALRVDLKQFGLGDGAEVGERGTVVSGGQKARISLARALYSPAKFLLLDDVLSAVDSNTAQHIVLHALQGPLMRHRTCILVTHAIELCLPLAEFVVYLKDGQVVSSGAPEKVALPPVEKLEVLKEEAVKYLEDDESVSDDEVHKLVKEEKQSQGAVPFSVYWVHIQAMGGLWMLVGALACFLAAQLCEIAVSLTLRYWAGSYDAPPASGASLLRFASYTHWTGSALDSAVGQKSMNYWLTLYVSLSVLNMVLYGARVGYFLHRGIVASRTIYESLIARILGSPIRFFDSVPSGQILNRLSSDTETIDQELAPTELFLLVEVFSAVGIILAISAVLPAFLVAAFFVSVVYTLIGYVYVATSRELQRCGAVTRSPFFRTFTESLHGVVTMRAYGNTMRFLQKFINELDTNNRVVLTIWQANRWLSIRVDCAGALVTFAAAGFLLVSPGMDAALAGFILSFAVTFNDHMLQVVQQAGFLQLDINSIERVSEYLRLPQESVTGSVPPAIWPSRDGTLEVRHLVSIYAPGLPPALNDISFSVLPRQKIGICGRTGSGKSTLGLSLFRFIEATSGQILLDGLDIATLQLQDLRARLTIVTQETTLFAGSIRENLDPFLYYDDEELWEVLEKVTLARHDRESGLVKSLELPVVEGGNNFSAGQRQLLSLARGLLKLRSSSLLILDEATGSLDQATDNVIQNVIREELSGVTILCIAHRLRSICDYDKILVLGDGQVLEFDTPWTLLKNEVSAFSVLCRKSGDFEEIVRVVRAKREVGEGTS